MQRTLLYDGTCGLCARSVQFVLRNERGDHSLQFAPLQGQTASRLLQAHPELAGVDSVILVEESSEGSRALTRSSAVIGTLLYLGGVWRVLGNMLRIIPRFLRDWGYDFVARTRYRVFGRDTSCLLPSSEQRTRFHH